MKAIDQLTVAELREMQADLVALIDSGGNTIIGINIDGDEMALCYRYEYYNENGTVSETTLSYEVLTRYTQAKFNIYPFEGMIEQIKHDKELLASGMNLAQLESYKEKMKIPFVNHEPRRPWQLEQIAHLEALAAKYGIDLKGYDTI